MQVSLVMVTSDGQAKEFPVRALPLVIGRGGECKLRVPYDAVSRAHCELLDEDDELVVRDLKSSNGTYVNTQRIKQRELVPGDLLAVGPVVFVVRIDGHPKDVAAPVAYAAGAVAVPGASATSGVPTSQDITHGDPTPTTAPRSAAAGKPASKPALKKDDSALGGLLDADLSESDFDFDALLNDDDEKPKKK